MARERRAEVGGADEGSGQDLAGSSAAGEPEPSSASLDDDVKDVTFRLDAGDWAQTASLAGDFNDWSPDATPMTRNGDQFEVTVPLPAGREYRYRFVLDGHHWDSDPAADGYVPNEFGSEDSVRRV
jgi:1,4-alpha-glucan branching enzyme